MEKHPTCEKLIKIIDADSDDLVNLCLQLGNTPSPHGAAPIELPGILTDENRGST